MTPLVWQEQPRLWPGADLGSPAEPQVCLCLHGLGGGVYEFQFLVEFLTQKGVAVQTLLYPGHGPPPQPMPISNWRQWVDHSVNVLRSLQQNYRHITLIGFSTGAPVALHLALSQSIDALILVSPFLRLYRVPSLVLPTEFYLNTIGRLIPHLPRHRLAIRDPEMQSLSRSAPFSQTFRLQVVRSVLELIAQVKPQLAQIQVPTLILQSRRDTVVDPRGAEFIHQQLGSDHKQLIDFNHSEHNLLLDLERETCFARIWEFLQGITGLSVASDPQTTV